jgi:hypothetical protein
MTVEECIKCKYNRRYENGAVYCGYEKNIVSMVTVYNLKVKGYVILSCPKKKE